MRISGIIMPISCLPCDYGIGQLGSCAYAFADFLSDSGTSVWQILPLCPTSYGDSPYQSFSVFAGNPYYIDFEELESKGFLYRSEYRTLHWGDDPRRVDYAALYQICLPLLKTAASRFDLNDAAYQAFLKKNGFWLENYALFMALKDSHGGQPWYEWEEPLALRDFDALQNVKRELSHEIDAYRVMQYWFFTQWARLKAYCAKKCISILGDLPIYVAYDSADVWAQPELFLLNEKRVPVAVAGVPPDDFATTGQLWGNPLYDWKYHKKTGFAWWISRMRYTMQMVDMVRMDHFRGFESYYAVPYGNKTAEIGLWQPGPGLALFQAMEKELGKCNIIAEDLGYLTPEVRRMLKDSGYPGMKVLQFGFGGDPKSEYLPHNFLSTHCVAYTGTHDNTTVRGFVETADHKTLRFARRYLHCRNPNDLPNAIIRATWGSVAYLAVAQIQDFLDFGDAARMNTPSTLGGNWEFRTISDDFTARFAKRIYRMNELYNRLAENPHRIPSHRAKTLEENTASSGSDPGA